MYSHFYEKNIWFNRTILSIEIEHLEPVPGMSNHWHQRGISTLSKGHRFVKYPRCFHKYIHCVNYDCEKNRGGVVKLYLYVVWIYLPLDLLTINITTTTVAATTTSRTINTQVIILHLLNFPLSVLLLGSWTLLSGPTWKYEVIMTKTYFITYNYY